MSWDIEGFKEKLETNHVFPGRYIFKFIVKPKDQTRVKNLLPHAEVSIKPSSGNKYVSVTLNAEMNTSREVIEIYKKAKKIEGIIAL